MSALKRKTREMLAAHARSKPPVAAGTAIGDAIAALRAELETQRCRAVEIEALIARLTAYTGAENRLPLAAGSNATPIRRRRRHRGRPLVDAAAALRAKKAAAMRQRRARLRAEAAAAAAAATPPVTPPKAKPVSSGGLRSKPARGNEPREKEKAAPSEPKAEIAADAPSPKTNGGVPKKPKPQKLRKDVGVPTSGVKPVASEWTTDAAGNPSRSLVAPGEAVPLKLV